MRQTQKIAQLKLFQNMYNLALKRQYVGANDSAEKQTPQNWASILTKSQTACSPTLPLRRNIINPRQVALIEVTPAKTNV